MTKLVKLSSANGVLALLDEPNDKIKVHALNKLNNMVDHFWLEIASAIPKIEMLYEDENFSNRKLAAVVASKVFYNLEELDDAVKYALGAGDLFDISEKNEYVETLIAKCIDDYCRLRKLQYDREHNLKQYDNNNNNNNNSNDDDDDDDEKNMVADDEIKIDIDSRLEVVVERMFNRCIEDGEYKQAIGISLESHRLDMLKKVIEQSNEQADLLAYLYSVAKKMINSRVFRHEILRVLVELYGKLDSPDYMNMCQCYQSLNEHEPVADTLLKLIESSNIDDNLMAYQVAFDLHDNQNPAFLNRVSKSLPNFNKTSTNNNETKEETEEIKQNSNNNETSNNNNNNDNNNNNNNNDNTTTTTTTTTSNDNNDNDNNEDDVPVVQPEYVPRLERLKSILSGELPTELYLQFLYTQNKTDLNILKNIKEHLDAKNTVTHTATIMSHAIFQCGTTVDTFIRDDLDWLKKATHWASFTATAAIGVVHQGHCKKSHKVLESYLPDGVINGPGYQEGGALYGLGLIHSMKGADQIDYLLNALIGANDKEVVQHGACLGLGLCAMGTKNLKLVQTLKEIVYQNNAVSGEAAGLAIGLILLGSGSKNNEDVEEMLAYARDTNHEKLIRGLALGLALTQYAQEEAANTLIEDMLSDKDPLLRYGGVYAIALAYVGTSNNWAIKKLLHLGVSDASDDVRRGAVMSLGFVMCNSPEQVPKIVGLLSESYNTHVRYGSAMAVGIACAGSGLQEALDLIEPLLKDSVDYVRQGAYIGMAMVLIQHNGKQEKRVDELRKLINDSLNHKGDTMFKFGAIIAAGILDAGGRNVSISLLSANGHRRISAIVGAAIFPQFWYWYPLIHFMSLCFTPTAVIGLNKDLKIPKDFQIISKAPPSLYAYPPPIEIKKKEVKKKGFVAELSVTAKSKLKKLKRAASSSNISTVSKDAMDVDEEEKTDNKTKEEDDDKTKVQDDKAKEKHDDKTKDNTEEKKDEEKKEVEVEPEFVVLSNPTRVTWKQQKVIEVEANQRYVPIKKRIANFVMLRDTKPDESENIYEPQPPTILPPGVSADEPPVPQPFQLPN